MEVKASMAGTVLNILISKGDNVLSGQELIMLESMKMEIPMECEMDGEVTEIKVSEGDFVNEGDVLVVLR